MEAYSTGLKLGGSVVGSLAWASPIRCLAFVTENTGEKRSCFQALDLSLFEPGKFLRTVDLHEIKRFGLFAHNVRQHEDLARKLFGLLSEIKGGVLA